MDTDSATQSLVDALGKSAGASLLLRAQINAMALRNCEVAERSVNRINSGGTTTPAKSSRDDFLRELREIYKESKGVSYLCLFLKS